MRPNYLEAALDRAIAATGLGNVLVPRERSALSDALVAELRPDLERMERAYYPLMQMDRDTGQLSIVPTHDAPPLELLGERAEASPVEPAQEQAP